MALVNIWVGEFRFKCNLFAPCIWDSVFIDMVLFDSQGSFIQDWHLGHNGYYSLSVFWGQGYRWFLKENKQLRSRTLFFKLQAWGPDSHEFPSIPMIITHKLFSILNTQVWLRIMMGTAGQDRCTHSLSSTGVQRPRVSCRREFLVNVWICPSLSIT